MRPVRYCEVLVCSPKQLTGLSTSAAVSPAAGSSPGGPGLLGQGAVLGSAVSLRPGLWWVSHLVRWLNETRML